MFLDQAMPHAVAVGVAVAWTIALVLAGSISQRDTGGRHDTANRKIYAQPPSAGLA